MPAALSSRPHAQPTALARLLGQHLPATGWEMQDRASCQAMVLTREEVLARDGLLCVLLVHLATLGAVPPQALSVFEFVAYEEPSDYRLLCGFFLKGEPSPEVWALPLRRWLIAAHRSPSVGLAPAWASWASALVTRRVGAQGLPLVFQPPPPVR